MDILGAALFSALVYSKESKQSPYLLALLCSLLALVHPNFWFAAGIVFISVWAGTRYNFKVFLVAGIPLLMYGIWIFPWLHLIEEQLISNGTDHVETGGDILRRIQDYFYLRYFKWYEIQQILPVVYIYALVAGALLFASNTSLRVWVILLWIQTLFLMFFTGTFPRYNLPVVLCVWTLLPVLIRKLPQWSLRGKSASVFSLGCILLALYPLISRSATALLQLDSRDSEKVLNWIKNSLPEKEKYLLCDEAIGYYVQKPNVDFTLIHTKDKFDFSKYPGGVYWLTYESEPDSGFEKVSEYSCDPGNYPVWLPAPQTYAGLKLYRVKTQKTWDALQP